MGTPVAINADGTVNENDQKSVQQAGKRAGDSSPNDQPVPKKPLQQQQSNR